MSSVPYLFRSGVSVGVRVLLAGIIDGYIDGKYPFLVSNVLRPLSFTSTRSFIFNDIIHSDICSG